MTEPASATERLREYAARTVEYVERAVGVRLGFDSDTLPLLDHYLRHVPAEQAATTQLVIATAAAYFGLVVEQHLGGRWETPTDDMASWRVVLPTGLSFSPTGMVGAAIVRRDADDLDTVLDAPQRMRPYVEQALARMGPVTEHEFYSLCGRLDTLEHIHEVLVAVAAQLSGGPVPDGDDEGADEPEPDPSPPGDLSN